MKSMATGTNSASVRASRSRQSWMNSLAMIPHSRLLIAVPALAARLVAGGGRLAPPLALPRRMIPHSRLLIAVRSSGLAQRAELLAYAALPLLVHERDEDVLDRRLHLTRPGDRSSALGEQPSHTLGVGTARSNDQPQASPHAHDLLDRLHVGPA